MLFGIRWGSLRLKIIAWSFVPTAIILTAVALVGFQAYQRVTEKLTIESSRELARLSASKLTGQLAEYGDTLTALARTADIYRNNPAAQRAALKQASNRLAIFDAGVLILDNYGLVVAVEPERPDLVGQDWSGQEFFRQMVRSPGTVFSQISSSQPQGTQVILVAVPITGDQGELTGTMVGMFRMGATSVSSFYGSIVKLRIGAETVYLVDRSGIVLYHTDAERVGDDFSSQEAVQLLSSGQADARRTRDFAGREIVASFSPVPGTSWGLVTEQNWNALLVSGQSYGRYLLLLLILGLLVPAVVVTFGVRRITEPIAKLIVATQEVAGGRFGPEITVHTGDELEELARQFNLMSAQLEQSYTALQEREERFALAMQGANDGLWDWDLKTNQVYYSPRWKSMLGYDEHEIEPHFSAWDRLVHPDDRQPAVQVIEAFRAGQADKYEIEFRMRHKDGHYVNILSRAFGVRETPQGPIVRLVGTHIDITERKRAEEEIRRQNEYLAALHETTLGVVGHLDIQELLEAMVERAVKLVGASEGWVHLVRPGQQEIESVVETGKHRQYVGLRFKPGEGLSGRIWQSGQPLAVENYHTWPGHSPQFDDDQLGPAMGVPLQFGSQVVGVVGLTRTPPAPLFGQDEIDLMSRFAHLASIALENARLHTSLQEELAERARTQEALQERLAFEDLITTISTNFINLEPDKIDDGIRQALQAIGEFANVDRSYVFLLSDDKSVTCCGHEWYAAGVESRIHNLQNVTVSVVPWFDEKIKRLEVVYVPRLADLPPEASAARAAFQSQGIQSMIAVPMAYRGSAVGFLGLDSVRTEKTWSEHSAGLLRIVGEIFANALEHKWAQEALQSSEARFRAVFEGAAIGMAISDMEGRLLKTNPALERMLGYSEEELGRMSITDYSHPDDVKIQQALDDETAAGKRDRYQIEKRYIRQDGQSIMWGRMTHSVARGDKGEPLFYIGMVEDITEQKQAQEALQAAYQTLERRVEERTHELATLNAIAAVVSRSLDLKEILSNALDKMLKVTNMGCGGAYRLEGDGEGAPDRLYLNPMVYRGLSEEFVRYAGPMPLQGSAIEVAASTGAPYVWEVRSSSADTQMKQALKKERVELVVTVPLMAKGRLVGAIQMGARGVRAFAPEELSLLAAIGQQVGLAVENARLYEQAEQAAAMAERNRLARELHDSVTQSLYSMTLYAEAAARLLTTGQHQEAADHLRELRDTAQEALREMRLLIFELRPLALERSGLIAALQTRLEAVEGRGGMQTELQVEGAQVIEQLPFFMQEELYHIAQEALNNVIKHAKAQRVQVHLGSEGSVLCLQVSDDGVGFLPAVVQEGGGLGLRGMKERAQRIGGTLQIDSVPGTGTRVTLQVPAS